MWYWIFRRLSLLVDFFNLNWKLMPLNHFYCSVLFSYQFQVRFVYVCNRYCLADLLLSGFSFDFLFFGFHSFKCFDCVIHFEGNGYTHTHVCVEKSRKRMWGIPHSTYCANGRERVSVWVESSQKNLGIRTEKCAMFVVVAVLMVLNRPGHWMESRERNREKTNATLKQTGQNRLIGTTIFSVQFLKCQRHIMVFETWKVPKPNRHRLSYFCLWN